MLLPFSASSGLVTPVREAIVPVRFDVTTLSASAQLLAWRERVGQFVDVEVSRARTQIPFNAWFDRYAVGDYVFLNCYSDHVALERSIGRISRDNARSITFHVFFRGDPATILRHRGNRHDAPDDVGVLAADLEQPLRWARQLSWHANIFVPSRRLQALFIDPGILHGRCLAASSPDVMLITEMTRAYARDIRHMTRHEAYVRLERIVDLIGNAYGKDLGLGPSAQAVAREHAMNRARRFIHEHLFDSDLTPERVLRVSGLSRASLYRLFEHQGGLAAYIRDLRLRAAATDLVRLPDLPIKDIAYSVGFKSASDFSRAFRRAFDTTPQELRGEMA